LSLSKR